MITTFIFIIITVLVTIKAFNDHVLLNKLLLYPYIMKRPQEYYRMLTSGFIHADWNHLIFNMLTLFFFGQYVDVVLHDIMGPLAPVVFGFLYLSAIILSSVPAMVKHKDNGYYRSLGASGGVSAVLFFVIYYYPWSKIQFMFIPVGIPAILYGIAYSVYSAYMAKRGTDNIGHDAHLGGGVYGFVFAFLVDPYHGLTLIEQLKHPTY